VPRKKRRRQSPSPTFFVDRSLGAKVVPSSLRSVGEKVEVHDDHFSQTAEDVVWIAKCGKKGWIALTRDTKIRAREIERKAVKSSGVYMFILVSKGLSGKDMKASQVAISAKCNLIFYSSSRRSSIAAAWITERWGSEFNSHWPPMKT